MSRRAVSNPLPLALSDLAKSISTRRVKYYDAFNGEGEDITPARRMGLRLAEGMREHYEV
jgi:hypothetical protein